MNGYHILYNVNHLQRKSSSPMMISSLTHTHNNTTTPMCEYFPAEIASLLSNNIQTGCSDSLLHIEPQMNGIGEESNVNNAPVYGVPMYPEEDIVNIEEEQFNYDIEDEDDLIDTKPAHITRRSIAEMVDNWIMATDKLSAEEIGKYQSKPQQMDASLSAMLTENKSNEDEILRLKQERNALKQSLKDGNTEIERYHLELESIKEKYNKHLGGLEAERRRADEEQRHR